MPFNTDNMMYVIHMTDSDTERRFDFMSDLVKFAAYEDFKGNGFYCYIEHTTPSGSTDKIPFMV